MQGTRNDGQARQAVRLAFGALMLAATAILATAQAQAPAKPRLSFAVVVDAPTPTDGLEVPTAAKLADRLGKVWHDIADRTCADEKKLDLAAYHKLARTMIIAVGDHMQALAATALDVKVAEAAFTATAGPGAAAELEKLAADPAVKELLTLKRKADAVGQTNTYLDNIERAMLLTRIQTTQRASPIAVGDQDILIEMENVESAPAEFIDTSKSPAVQRFMDLAAKASESYIAGSNKELWLTWGPTKLMPILLQPLKDHCIKAP